MMLLHSAFIRHEKPGFYGEVEDGLVPLDNLTDTGIRIGKTPYESGTGTLHTGTLS